MMNRKAPLQLDNETKGTGIPKVKNADDVGHGGADPAAKMKAASTGTSANMGNAAKFLNEETERGGVKVGGHHVKDC